MCCGHLWVWHMFCGQDLWWTIPLHVFHWSCWDTLWIPNDHMDLCQTHCVQVPDFSSSYLQVYTPPKKKLLSCFKICKWKGEEFLFWVSVHGMCFGCCFSGPLPLRSLTNGPPIGVRFWESLVVRLHSEIDQIHLGIEAQCVTTLLPLGDINYGRVGTKNLVEERRKAGTGLVWEIWMDGFIEPEK